MPRNASSVSARLLSPEHDIFSVSVSVRPDYGSVGIATRLQSAFQLSCQMTAPTGLPR
jgi:hypothetical protein